MEAHKETLQQIISRARVGEESFQIDPKKAVEEVIAYLKEKDLIKGPEKKESYLPAKKTFILVKNN